MSTTRKTSSYLMSVPTDDPHPLADHMKAACPVPVDTSGVGDGQAFIRYRASSVEEAIRIAQQVKPTGEFFLSIGYGVHFKPVPVP